MGRPNRGIPITTMKKGGNKGGRTKYRSGGDARPNDNNKDTDYKKK